MIDPDFASAAELAAEVYALRNDLEAKQSDFEAAMRKIAELQAERDEARAEAAQACADMEPIDALRGELEIARNQALAEWLAANAAREARNDMATRLRAMVAARVAVGGEQR